MENTLSSNPTPTAPRYRVQYGCLYVRDTLPYAYVARVHSLGHGHTEAVLTPRYNWHEVDEVSPLALSDAAMADGNIFVGGAWEPDPTTQQQKLDQVAANRLKSSRRARTKVRRLCKSKGLRVMLTLTYRENMVDRDRMARDFDVFVKRVRRVVPDFPYVCVFERQKRGAWHAHIAVPRVLSHYLHRGVLVRSYDLLRSLWRGVVGQDNGNIDVSRNKRLRRSGAKLASYLSKYITKTFQERENSRDAYSASGRDLPRPVCVELPAGNLRDAANLLAALVSLELANAGDITRCFLDGGGLYLSLSPS